MFFKFTSLGLFLFGFVLKVNTNIDRFKSLMIVDPSVTPVASKRKIHT
jgi:hypothetical protein